MSESMNASPRSCVMLGVVGWPLAATLSPPMQQAALDHVRPSWHYGRFAVPPGGMESFVASAATRMRGLNVTLPYKGQVRRMCTQTDRLSKVSGAVNTVVFDDIGIQGHNTDGPGLLQALAGRAGFDPHGSRVLIAGAGGAARGCAAALTAAGATAITVVNRTGERSRALCEELAEGNRRCACAWIAAAGLEHALADAGQADLVLNCVPPEGSAAWCLPLLRAARPGTVFMDLNYATGGTGLHHGAGAEGLEPVSGLEMLLWQGVYALELFTGEHAPVSAMRQALVDAAGEW